MAWEVPDLCRCMHKPGSTTVNRPDDPLPQYAAQHRYRYPSELRGREVCELASCAVSLYVRCKRRVGCVLES